MTDLDGLRPEVREAVARICCTGGRFLNEGSNFADLQTICAELVRLQAERDELDSNLVLRTRQVWLQTQREHELEADRDSWRRTAERIEDAKVGLARRISEAKTIRYGLDELDSTDEILMGQRVALVKVEP